ncbi:glycoside hydrolase family 2 [Frateuria sp. STR12]|uniref:glycoside hydrolase family 2 n=1 Tax=Frateuria hangzhouensis TaxID=2995589 RepID=UPI002260F386|nr:glycoside hydrolase family 2 [Frateuria sp. STR12]MCX7514665.1 glycoside hydrolase family 2 [Frateuria sp. STR12]
MAGIGIVTLLVLVIMIAELAIGGRPDPAPLRAASTLLDGPWRFHVGDDPGWAAPDMEDSRWETMDMTAPAGSHDGDVGLPDYVGGWMAHGHPGYHGYAWYRRTVTIPAGDVSWAILGPTLVEDGYELYWNGRLLGGSGRLGPDPHLVGTRPLQFALPAGAEGTTGVLAIRTYMLPSSATSAEGGGMHTPPILAPQPAADALHRAQWQRTIAGYIVDAVEPAAMLALIGLALVYGSRSRHKAFLAFACVALALTAARRLNNAIVSWTDLQDLTTYVWLASVMWIPMISAWLLAWNRWCRPAWRSIDVLAVALGIAGIVGVLGHQATWTSVSRLGSIALFVVIAVRIARSGPMRVLALAALASIVAALFGAELLAPLGVPGIWFPFNIGVSRTQYIYAISIPLLAFLLVRDLSPRGARAQEEMAPAEAGALADLR